MLRQKQCRRVADAAQPALGRDTCQVTFVRAPDDVRLAIERWVAAEPTCTGAIELRVFGWAATATGGTFRIQNTLTLTGTLR